MKKVMLLALFIVGAFVACGDSTPPAENPSSAPTSSGSAAPTTAPADSAATPAK